MNKAITQFEANIESVRQLGIIYLAFRDKVTQAINLDELLRAELVLAVGALDCYIHDLVRIRMSVAFRAGQGESNAYLSFGVSLKFVKELISVNSESDKLNLFEQEISRLHGFRTFQTAENISQALSFININNLWVKVGNILGMNSADVKTRLNLIVDRRNRIAHESDVDPSLGIGNKYPIDFPLVNDAIGFLESITHAIQQTAQAELGF
ncbi:MAG: hypothetical protein ISS63_04270 [Desulfobacteraceae bacterium]|nr:hypothetical protein [Desulfobacteraceae bacterium]